MKKWVIFLLYLVIFSLCTGCSRSVSHNGIGTHVVRRIQIHCETCDTIIHREYTDPEKIRLILLCIRKLGPDFPPRTDVEALSGKTLGITLTCADGSITTYRIKNNLYIQKNDSPWRQINLNSATGFYQMIMEIPDDSPEKALPRLPIESPAHRVYSPAIRNFRKRGKS